MTGEARLRIERIIRIQKGAGALLSPQPATAGGSQSMSPYKVGVKTRVGKLKSKLDVLMNGPGNS